MVDLIDKIHNANPKRNIRNVVRRGLKLSEETGEASQAILAVTSKNNGKKKTWCDVREELVDTIIVAMDILLTTFPDEEGMAYEEKRKAIANEIDRKLVKWEKKNKNQEQQDDAE